MVSTLRLGGSPEAWALSFGSVGRERKKTRRDDYHRKEGERSGRGQTQGFVHWAAGLVFLQACKAPFVPTEPPKTGGPPFPSPNPRYRFSHAIPARAMPYLLCPGLALVLALKACMCG